MSENRPSPRYIPKNLQYATIKDMPMMALPVSEFIQGPRYDQRSQRDSNVRALLFQNHEQRQREQEEREAKARETQEIALKVKEFQEDQAESMRRRRREEWELFQFNKKGIDLRKQWELEQQRQKAEEEKVILQQAILGKATEEKDYLKKRQVLREAARYNFEEAQIRRKIREDRFARPELPERRNSHLPIDENEFANNANKFFGIDQAEILRITKNQVKTRSHDPINGTTRNYYLNKSPPRPLGAGQPEHFPGKINDFSSSPEMYQLPQFRKRAPRFVSFNPLIHQAMNYRHAENYQPAVKTPIQTQIPPQGFEKPILKGMGYRKSNIFD